MKNLFLLVIYLCLTACSIDPLDFYNPTHQKSYLKNNKGEIIDDCTISGDYNFIRVGDDTERFWKGNKLPKGTTEFVCVDGKAYLPGKEPKK